MDRENNYKLEWIDLDDDTQVNSGGATNIQQLKPPVGYTYEVRWIEYAANDPVGSGSGTHKVQYRIDGQTYYVIQISANSGTNLSISGSGFAGTSDTPSAVATQYEFMTKSILIASNEIPINVVYTNSTDVNQTATRKCRFLVKKYREAI